MHRYLLLGAIIGGVGILHSLFRWLHRRAIQSEFDDILAKVRAGETPARVYESPYRISLLEDGFELVGTQADSQEQGYRLRWADVKQVFAYKDDAFTTDIICLGFRIDDQGTYYFIDEEMAGYEELLKVLPQHFPGIRQDWFFDVAVPAFERRETHLWGEEYVPPQRPSPGVS